MRSDVFANLFSIEGRRTRLLSNAEAEAAIAERPNSRREKGRRVMEANDYSTRTYTQILLKLVVRDPS